MSIEGARIGYVNPDQTTYDYIKGREYAPNDASWADVSLLGIIKTSPTAIFDDEVVIDGSAIEPMVLGNNPRTIRKLRKIPTLWILKELKSSLLRMLES